MNKKAFACVLCIKFYFLYVLLCVKNFGFGDIAKNMSWKEKGKVFSGKVKGSEQFSMV